MAVSAITFRKAGVRNDDMSTHTITLDKKINDKSLQVAVVGLGYAGLELALEMVRSGLKVSGIDTDEYRVKSIAAGKSYISDIPDAAIKKAIDTEGFSAHSDYAPVENADVVLFCVPTPLNRSQEPDLSFVRQSLASASAVGVKGKLFILESTTYPGTTREVALPLLGNGFKVGKDFFLAYSPERIDPGNNHFRLPNTTRIVGGLTPECGQLASDFFKSFIEKVHTVSTPEAAETTKLFENIFRCVNIALVNEMMLMCDRMNIDIWEVMQAAKTKEFGFMPFDPGPGLGGHCIPIDPIYLAWKAKEFDFHSEFIELAAKRNAAMPYYVMSKVFDALNQQQLSIKGSTFLLLGVAYKRNVNDVRESPALKIIELLKKKGGEVVYFDPYVEQVIVNGYRLRNKKLTKELLRNSDCTVIVTDHDSFDYDMVVANAPLIVDTRNVLRHRSDANIVRI